LGGHTGRSSSKDQASIHSAVVLCMHIIGSYINHGSLSYKVVAGEGELKTYWIRKQSRGTCTIQATHHRMKCLMFSLALKPTLLACLDPTWTSYGGHNTDMSAWDGLSTNFSKNCSVLLRNVETPAYKAPKSNLVQPTRISR
jgi:hypothetical protein